MRPRDPSKDEGDQFAHGRRDVSVDELIAKGRTVADRVRPIIERASQKLRSRFGRK